MAHLDPLVQNSIGSYQEFRDYFASLGRKSWDKGAKSASLKTLVVTPPLQKSLLGEKFLLFDSCFNGNDRVICFSTKKNLRRLLEADQWLANATFRSSPKIFRQLWSIHAQFEERTLPMVYFLMNGQTQSCYEHALTRFKMELDGELNEFYRDFPAKKR